MIHLLPSGPTSRYSIYTPRLTKYEEFLSFTRSHLHTHPSEAEGRYTVSTLHSCRRHTYAKTPLPPLGEDRRGEVITPYERLKKTLLFIDPRRDRKDNIFGSSRDNLRMDLEPKGFVSEIIEVNLNQRINFDGG